MAAKEPIDFRTVRQICVRLFTNRKMQPWPAHVVKGNGWDSLYDVAKLNIDGIMPLDEAIAWANKLIVKIDAAR